MKEPIEVIGVHPIDGTQSVWLIEVRIAVPFDQIEWGAITQSDPNLDPSSWQVAYDEQCPIGESNPSRAVFFFHYLDPDRPLESVHGLLSLPKPTPVPARLRVVRYEPP